MSDDDPIDPGRNSAPVPDFDEDLETRLTPGDELARWRRMAARTEPQPAAPKEPLPPSSRPLLGGAKVPGADEKTPERGIPAIEATPARGTPIGDSQESTRVMASPLDPPVVRHLKEGPLRTSAPPGRTSPAPAAPRGSPWTVPAGDRPASSDRPPGPSFAVFSPPSRGSDSGASRLGDSSRPSDSGASRLPQTTTRDPGATASDPGAGLTSLPPSLAPRDEPRAKPALAPPPPTNSLAPIDHPPLPPIPPAPPLGFSSPPPQSDAVVTVAAAAVPSRTERAPRIVLAVVLVLVGGGVAAFFATGGRLPSSTTPATPAPAGTTAPSATTAPAPADDAGAALAVAVPAPEAVPADEVDPPEPPAIADLIAAGDAALAADDAEAALASYLQVTELDVHDPYGQAGAARALLALGRAAEAIPYAARAVAHRQRRASFRILLGDAYEAAGNHARATEEWRVALELEPDGLARRRLGE